MILSRSICLSVCLSVCLCLFVCEDDYSKSCRRCFMKFLGNATRNKLWDDWDQEPEIFFVLCLPVRHKIAVY